MEFNSQRRGHNLFLFLITNMAEVTLRANSAICFVWGGGRDCLMFKGFKFL